MARDGVAVAEIARRLGIRYQHAYNVLKAVRSGSRLGKAGPVETRAKSSTAYLSFLAGGFCPMPAISH
jgi:hypothetical protein